MKTSSVLAAAVLAGLTCAAGCGKEKGEKEEAVEAQPSAPAAATATAFPVEAPDSLRALARISLDSASKLALARVPAGTIEKVELERERGALIWSFDLTVPGKTGIDEVAVNAVTGAVGRTEHETPAAEATEAREDSGAARRPATPPRRP